jgi:Dolichyl-phosphate-mannose-protein mannosyltransferase
MRPGLRSKLAIGSSIVVLAFAAFQRHGDFGTTWDDPFHAKVGALALRYFESGGRDLAIAAYDDARFYGPLHDLIPAMLRGSDAPLDAAHFDLRHLWNAFFALLLVPALWRFGRALNSRTAGWIAVVALLAQPRFLGDVFLNSKDIPFAVGVAWFHLGLLRVLGARSASWRDWIAFGGGFGLALLERPGGFVLLFVEALVAFGVRDALRGGARDAARPSFLVGFGAALAIAWVAMIAPWPSAHHAPLLHPLRTMGAAARFYTEYPVLWDGAFRSSAALPRTYLPFFLAVTMPLTIAGLALLGLIGGVRDLVRRPASRRALVVGLLCAWIVVPVGAAVVLRPNLYDGIRHFSFVLPAVALFAAYGFQMAWRIGGTMRAPARLVAAIALLAPFHSVVRLHPYESTYFNPLVGGVAGASGRFETDYFATAYREAMHRVANVAARHSQRRFVVWVGGSESMFDGVRAHAPANVELVLVRPDREHPAELPIGVDAYLGCVRFGLAEDVFAATPIVARIGRDAATFAVIRSRDPIW